jgi:hypothetical protein
MNAALRLLLISIILLASFQQGFPLNKKTAQQDSLSATKAREGLVPRPPLGWNSYDCFGMLAMGKLSIRTDLKDQKTRRSRLTQDEQTTVMSLWSIFRSPLMFGGNMTDNDEFTLSLLTNEEVLAVDQNSIHNKELRAKDGWIVWTADVPNSKDKYIALFNYARRRAGGGRGGLGGAGPGRDA